MADGGGESRENAKPRHCDCGAAARPNRTQCQACADNDRKQRQERYQKRKESGVCVVCQHEVEPGQQRCDNCRARDARRQVKKREQRSRAGHCAYCGFDLAKDPFPQAATARQPYCGPCLFKRLGRKRGEKAIPAADLIELFHAQEGRCALSGRPLFLNGNISIDHKKATVKGGKHILANVQLLDYHVNNAKHALEESEYLRLCFDVVKHQLAKSGLTSIHFGQE